MVLKAIRESPVVHIFSSFVGFFFILGVSSRSPYDKHILTVQAIDRDAIGTGVVRYNLVEGYRNPDNLSQTMFGIHEKFGVISNKILMREFAGLTFSVTVNARDRVSIEDSESANTSALVCYHGNRKWFKNLNLSILKLGNIDRFFQFNFCQMLTIAI